MTQIGKITAIHPEDRSSTYNYICRGEKGIFSFPVGFRYHMRILEEEGGPKEEGNRV